MALLNPTDLGGLARRPAHHQGRRPQPQCHRAACPQGPQLQPPCLASPWPCNAVRLRQAAPRSAQGGVPHEDPDHAPSPSQSTAWGQAGRSRGGRPCTHVMQSSLQPPLTPSPDPAPPQTHHDHEPTRHTHELTQAWQGRSTSGHTPAPCSSSTGAEHTQWPEAQPPTCSAAANPTHDQQLPGSYQQHDQPAGGQAVSTTRRAACVASLVAAGQAALSGVAPAAHALKTVTLRDGSSVEVFEHGMSLSIVSLRGSIPQEWILEFKTALGKYAGFSLGQRAQLADIYKELSDPAGTKNSACMADVVTLGDAWLGPAVKAGLVQPIPNAEASRWWRSLSPRWRALVRRDTSGRQDPKGAVYASPYRWGATLIAYRRDKLLSAGGSLISDWSHLLQPQLTGRVAMTDSSREFLGAALKATVPFGGGAPSAGLGYNACSKALQARGVGAQELAEAARKLRRQVKLFSNRDHVRAFVAGDVWAVVGWSQDLITLAERSNNVEVVVPASGTALFADLWTVPSHAQGGHMQSGPSPVLPSWLEFGLQPARTMVHASLKSGAAPLLLDQALPTSTQAGSGEGQNAGVVLTHDNGYMPRDHACLSRSEFLLPLDADTLALYSEALQKLQN